MSELKLNLTTPPRGREYTLLVDRILKDLDGEDREAVEEALHDKRWSNEGLSRALSKGGIEVSAGAIRTWRARNAN